jgi:hypothetical protein
MLLSFNSRVEEPKITFKLVARWIPDPVYMWRYLHKDFASVENVPLVLEPPVKVKLLLCLTKHHAMETYWGVEV